MARMLIVHGLNGSPASHWQHWWAATDANAVMVDLPDAARPVPEVWENELAGAILHHPGAVLVGHSLGAVLIARVLTRWQQLPVGGALLVAPAETTGSDRIGHFGTIPDGALGVPALVVASRNDPWMSFDRAAALAQGWGAGLFDLGLAGHVNVASGFGPWPQGKALAAGLSAIGRVRRARTAPAQRGWL